MIYTLSDGPLLVLAHATTAGQQVVEVILNAPDALNALNGDMVDLLLEHVPAWEADEDVIAIVMRGTGSKAFVQEAIYDSSIMRLRKATLMLAKNSLIMNTLWILCYIGYPRL